MKITVNGKQRTVDVEPDTPLLWVLRDELAMRGTKFGCGAGLCGACTVHMDGKAMRACVLPVSAVGDAEIRTIEGLSEDGSHPLQQAWADHNRCTAGPVEQRISDEVLRYTWEGCAAATSSRARSTSSRLSAHQLL